MKTRNRTKREVLSQHQSYRRIYSADSKGQIALVFELCEKHLRRFPDDCAAWVLYGMARTEMSQYDAAERDLRRAIALCPKRGLQTVFTQMGQLFEVKGNFKKAEFWYRRASRHDLDDATYHIFLGHISFRQGRLVKAETHYRRAIKCSEGSIDEAYFNLGGVLLARKRYKEAINCYRKAIEIDPHYGIAKKRLKDAELALEVMSA